LFCNKQPKGEKKEEDEKAKEDKEIIKCVYHSMAINCADTLSKYTNRWDFECNDTIEIRKIQGDIRGFISTPQK
jgi:hypothetical protein